MFRAESSRARQTQIPITGTETLALTSRPTAIALRAKPIRAALKNAGFAFPMRKVVINLTPADVRKEGPIYDLPIAVGILAASEAVAHTCLDDYLFLGEMSLDGTLRPVAGRD